MDGFEALIAELLEAEGYWVRRGHKVELTKAEKVKIGRPSSPRWEIDLLAYRPADNSLLAVECKSYLDSPGVRLEDLRGGKYKDRYKLFTDGSLRGVVFNALGRDLGKAGLCPRKPKIQLALAAGHVKGDVTPLRNYFDSKKWRLFDPDWIREMLAARADAGYSDSVAVLAARVLLRTGSSDRSICKR